MKHKPCSKCGRKKTQSPSGRWRCKPCDNAYQRNYYLSHPEVKGRKAKWMREARKNPEKHRKMIKSSRKAYRSGGNVKQKEHLQRMQIEEPFRWKTKLVRRWNKQITESDLKRLWDKQNRVCALTGKSITIQEAELDHIVPQSRGGSHKLENLRWVWARANQAKKDLLDTEFVELCTQVAEWIGRQLKE